MRKLRPSVTGVDVMVELELKSKPYVSKVHTLNSFTICLSTHWEVYYKRMRNKPSSLILGLLTPSLTQPITEQTFIEQSRPAKGYIQCLGHPKKYDKYNQSSLFMDSAFANSPTAKIDV